MKRKVHVILASDNYYFSYIFVAVKTLYSSNKNITDLCVHYIEQDVKEENLQLLKDLGKDFGRNVDIIKFDMPKEFDEVLPAYGAASKTTYVKFWFASMFPEEDRVLYLDPDVLVMDSIEEMYNLDFEGNLIAGVIENLPWYHMKGSLLSEQDSYINGGMVLCNLEGWRKENLEERALIRLKDTTLNLNYDQGILNELCKSKVLVIPPKYNALAEIFEFKSASKIMKRYGFTHYYTQEEIDNAVNNPTIIHFTGFLYGKPMSKKCTHPYAHYFQEKLAESSIEFALNNQDIDFKKKLRKFFLRYLPFGCYLQLEKILDIRRSGSYLNRTSLES